LDLFSLNLILLLRAQSVILLNSRFIKFSASAIESPLVRSIFTYVILISEQRAIIFLCRIN
jgi:hypothetical protein